MTKPFEIGSYYIDNETEDLIYIIDKECESYFVIKIIEDPNQIFAQQGEDNLPFRFHFDNYKFYRKLPAYGSPLYTLLNSWQTIIFSVYYI